MCIICCIFVSKANRLSALSFLLPTFHAHQSILEMMHWVSL